jgi:hypothetical protein
MVPLRQLLYDKLEKEVHGQGRAGRVQRCRAAKKKLCFQDGCRAGSLEEVSFTDIEHLDFDL